MLDEVEKQLQETFEGHGAGQLLGHEALVGDVFACVPLQRNRRGEPVFRYWFGESRVHRRTFQTMTCTEAHCPQRQAVMQKWLVHVGRAKPVRLKSEGSERQGALAAEERIQIADKAFIAREARFPMTLQCQHQAHEPLRISVKGWGLLGEGSYLAGGWAGEAPMFETLAQVEQWLAAYVPHERADNFPV